MAAVTSFTGYSYEFFDCRNLRKELYILENYVCFNTNWYVIIINIFMAVSACLLFFLSWTVCVAIKEIDDSYDQT